MAASESESHLQKDRRPSRTEALKRIVELARKGKTRPTIHRMKRSKERAFNTQHFWSVLRSGSIHEEGEWDPEKKSYKFRVVGEDPDGLQFMVVVALSGDELVLISGMGSVKSSMKESWHKQVLWH